MKKAAVCLAMFVATLMFNGNFPQNKERYWMPSIQGIIALCDGDNGYPLALMDSIEISILRTGAATAVAAKYLARADAKVATIRKMKSPSSIPQGRRCRMWRRRRWCTRRL